MKLFSLACKKKENVFYYARLKTNFSSQHKLKTFFTLILLEEAEELKRQHH